jgi:hypothetical protein
MKQAVSVNQKGGRRSKLSGRFDLLPAHGIRAAAEAFAEGENKYGRWDKDPRSPNWHFLDVGSDQSPISHLINHANQYAAGENGEDHLGHIIANAMMMCQYERDPASPWYGLSYPEMLAKAYREKAARKRKRKR